MKYPIELELTDFCWLKCINCINPYLENKSYMTLQNFTKVMSYVYDNRDSILYLNLSGIWDIFLHPDFLEIIDIICDRLSGSWINILIPNKWQSFTWEIINGLVKLRDFGFWVNISIWFFSMISTENDKMTQIKNFSKSLAFMLCLKKSNIQFSLEVASNSVLEKEYLAKIWKIFHVWYSSQWVHNFGWFFEKNTSTKEYKQSSFSVSNKYILDNFYCPFIPFISKDLKIYTCSISGKNNKFFYEDFDYFLINDICFLDMVYKLKDFLWNGNKCLECTIYQLSKWKRT